MDFWTFLAAIIVFVSLYILYYFVVCVHETEILYFGRDGVGGGAGIEFSSLGEDKEGVVDLGEILESCKKVKKFYPNAFFINRHCQTIGCKFLRRKSKNINYRREYFVLSDGGEIGLDWGYNEDESETTDTSSDTPIVLILHGLVGSSASTYISQVSSYMKNVQKWRPVVLNARGVGTTFLKTSRVFNGANTSDVREIASYIHAKYKNAPLVAVSYSLGANILTKYLGEEGSETPISAAISISNVFDFNKCSRLSRQTMSCRMYDKFLTRDMKNYVKRNQRIISESVSTEEIFNAKVVTDIDDLLITKMFGYESTTDYYNQASCIPYVPKVKIPMLFLNAYDDPVMPRHSKNDPIIPTDAIYKNPNVAFAITQRGGHIGYLKNFKFWDEAWCDQVAGEFLSKVLDAKRSSNGTMLDESMIAMDDATTLLKRKSNLL